jgi:hypothetical protein
MSRTMGSGGCRARRVGERVRRVGERVRRVGERMINGLIRIVGP